ncbi:MAG: hypothetical protein AABY10_00845 [Nanoarchaeota archaeon]
MRNKLTYDLKGINPPVHETIKRALEQGFNADIVAVDDNSFPEILVRKSRERAPFVMTCENARNLIFSPVGIHSGYVLTALPSEDSELIVVEGNKRVTYRSEGTLFENGRLFEDPRPLSGRDILKYVYLSARRNEPVSCNLPKRKGLVYAIHFR